MRTEVYINDMLIDLADESTIAATYGNITFGELNKRKGVKSNTWSAPFSTRNKLALESCELVSSASLIPYRNNNIRVEIDGVIVFEGLCTVEEASDGYDIQSFAGAADFYTYISTTKLAELDLSAYSHIWGEAAIRNSWTATEGYIYAFVGYGKDGPLSGSGSGYPQNEIIQPDYLLPQIFFSTVIKAIAADAGYSITGSVLTDDRFLKHVIVANKFPLPITYGNTFNLSLLLPDLMQSKVWLDFANIYGLQFDINEFSKEIKCIYIDDLLFNDADDWSGKLDLSEKQKTKYKIDNYGQTSYLKFKADPDTDLTGCTQDYAKDILIDDQTMDPEADIYKSDFYLIQNNSYPFVNLPFTKTFNIKDGIFSGVWDAAENYNLSQITKEFVWWNGSYFLSIQDGTNKEPGLNPTYWEAKAEKDIWEIKSRPMYGSLVTDIISPMTVAFSVPANVNRVIFATGLDWPTSYTKHYRVFSRIIDKTKSVEKLIKLNYADINQIRFDTLKQIDGELYILEEITQFKLNQPDSTICKFIRL